LPTLEVLDMLILSSFIPFVNLANGCEVK